MICIELLLMKLTGESISTIWEQKPIDNTAVSIIDVYEDGRFDIIEWGDNSHLPIDLWCSVPPVAGRPCVAGM